MRQRGGEKARGEVEKGKQQGGGRRRGESARPLVLRTLARQAAAWGPRLGRFPSDYPQSSTGQPAGPPMTSPRIAEPVLSVGGMTSEDKLTRPKWQMGQTFQKEDKPISTCLQMQGPRSGEMPSPRPASSLDCHQSPGKWAKEFQVI